MGQASSRTALESGPEAGTAARRKQPENAMTSPRTTRTHTELDKVAQRSGERTAAMRKLPVAVAVTLITLALGVSVALALAGTKPKTRASTGVRPRRRASTSTTSERTSGSGSSGRTSTTGEAEPQAPHREGRAQAPHRRRAPDFRSGPSRLGNRVEVDQDQQVPSLRASHDPSSWTTRNTTYRIVKGTSFKLAQHRRPDDQVQRQGRRSQRSVVQGGERHRPQAQADGSRSRRTRRSAARARLLRSRPPRSPLRRWRVRSSWCR